MKHNKDQLVSIIMNCHNGERYLKKSIKSVINQSYKKWELIFWDNLSNDKSRKIILEFKDKRIKYFKSKSFLKLYEARNQAIKKSNGKFVCFLDTDDWWVKTKLRKQLDHFYKIKNINKSLMYVKLEPSEEVFIYYRDCIRSFLKIISIIGFLTIII